MSTVTIKMNKTRMGKDRKHKGRTLEFTKKCNDCVVYKLYKLYNYFNILPPILRSINKRHRKPLNIAVPIEHSIELNLAHLKVKLTQCIGILKVPYIVLNASANITHSALF